MKTVRDVLRQVLECGLSARQAARGIGVSRQAVAEYLVRARLAGLSWVLVEKLDDASLETLLFPAVATPASRPLPAWDEVHAELKRKGVTLALLWEEYKGQFNDGLNYSRFCSLYRRWAGQLNLSMRLTHKAGEKLFIDYAGTTIPVFDPELREVFQAQIFVAVLGGSSYTYLEATRTQSLPDWIGSHVRAFEFFGGTTEILVPDNLKSGVTKPDPYEPVINSTYRDMATYYGAVVIPARVRKPKDKSLAEVAVQVVTRWVLARLRNRTFLSLGQLNAHLRALCRALNERLMRKLHTTRLALFEAIDKPALRALPQEPYIFAEWSQPKVGIDYHVELNRHFYSVPSQLVGLRLDARVTARTVELFHKGKRVASHARSAAKGRFTTVREHMPDSHQFYASWSPDRFRRWAAKIGPATTAVLEAIFAKRKHLEQGFRSCLGILRLAKCYEPRRLEAACERALALRALSYTHIANILKNGADRTGKGDNRAAPARPVDTDNIRGSDYFSGDPTTESVRPDPNEAGA